MRKKNNNVKIMNDIIEDIETYARNVARFAAQSVSDEMTNSAKEAIEYFYRDYSPTSYVRTGNLRNSYKKVYPDYRQINKYTGGVILSSDFMDDVYRGWFNDKSGYDTRELVFNLAYSGFHGLKAWTPVYDINGHFMHGEPIKERPLSPYHVTRPSPTELIEKKYKSVQRDIKKYIKNAETKADKLRR